MVIRYSLAQVIREFESRTKPFTTEIRFCSFKKMKGNGYAIFIKLNREVKLQADDIVEFRFSKIATRERAPKLLPIAIGLRQESADLGKLESAVTILLS
jgi:hypothetical protein